MSDPKTPRDNKTAALQALLPANQAYPAAGVPQFKEIGDRSITQIDQAKFAETEQIDSQSDNALPNESTNMALDYPAPLAGVGLMFDSEQTTLLAQASIEGEYGAAVAEEASGGLTSGAAAGAAAGAAGFASENAGLLALGGLGLIAIAGSGGGDGGIYYKTVKDVSSTFGSATYDPPGGGSVGFVINSLDPLSLPTQPGNIAINILGDNYTLFQNQPKKTGNSFTGGDAKNLSAGEFLVWVGSTDNGSINDILVSWKTANSNVYYDCLLADLQSDTQYINVEGYTFALAWSGSNISNISLA